MIDNRVPEVTFRTRVKDDTNHACHWQDITSTALFADRCVVFFALPGAFTPTCSLSHLPRYEALYDQFRQEGVDQVVCLSVNDPFVMCAWGIQADIHKVLLLPDGNGEFTRKMGMLVDTSNAGLGYRSWRYSMLVKDGVIQKMFVEAGFADNSTEHPLQVSDADTMLAYIREKRH